MRFYLILALILSSLAVSCGSINACMRIEESRKRETIARLATTWAAEEGTRANFTASGEDNTILTINDPLYTEAAIKILTTPEHLEDFRKMGFKQLIITNGKEQWKVDIN